MRVLTWNLALSIFLLVSCFVLPQTSASMIVTYGVFVLVLAVSMAALAKPSLRYLISATALAFAGCALLLPNIAWSTRVIDFLIAALMFALSLVSPRTAHWDEEEPEPIEPHPHHARATAH
jgi:hypothetical protein